MEKKTNENKQKTKQKITTFGHSLTSFLSMVAEKILDFFVLIYLLIVNHLDHNNYFHYHFEFLC